MKVSKENAGRAWRALQRVPAAPGRELPANLDNVYHAVVGMREARRAGWEPCIMTYWEKTLAVALEQWRVTREQIEIEEERWLATRRDDIEEEEGS